MGLWFDLTHLKRQLKAGVSTKNRKPEARRRNAARRARCVPQRQDYVKRKSYRSTHIDRGARGATVGCRRSNDPPCPVAPEWVGGRRRGEDRMSTGEEDAVQAMRRELEEAVEEVIETANKLRGLIAVQIGEIAVPYDVFVIYHKYRMATETLDRLSRQHIDSWA